MRILLVGNGGREHSIAWMLKCSSVITELYCAPGNAGIENVATCVPIKSDDVNGLLEFSKNKKIDLVVVGPEVPLVLGIADAFKRTGIKVFGPTREAAMLEGSKAYAKEFCSRHGISCARSKTFSDAESAKAYVQKEALPLVIKADGLAAGKGVLICETHREALAAIDDILIKRSFGDAGNRIVVEEFLDGEEASFLAIMDGNHVLALAGSRDHKRVHDGDEGPNTGGMGAVSPAKVLSDDVAQSVMESVMLPASRGMVTEGRPFVGVLYAGLMIKNGVPKVLEFNVRFGDPETQALMPRMKADLASVMWAAVTGSLEDVTISWDPRPSACVVLCSGGYPGSYERGKEIRGLDKASALKDVLVFHAGTRRDGARIVTDGGRVINVVALGENMKDATMRCYAAVENISFDGMHFRRDIGSRDI